MKTDPLKQALAFFDSADRKMGLLVADVVPKGFFTAAVFAKAKNKSVCAMRVRLNRMVENKLAEAQTFRLTDGHPALHYRILG